MYATDLIGQYVIRTENAPSGDRSATDAPVVIVSVEENDVTVGFYRCFEFGHEHENLYMTHTIKNANDDHWMLFADLTRRILPDALAYYAADHPWVGKVVISKSNPNSPKKILAMTDSHVLYSEARERSWYGTYQPIRIWHHSEAPTDWILYSDIISLTTESAQLLMKPFNPLIGTQQYLCDVKSPTVIREDDLPVLVLAMTPDFIVSKDNAFDSGIYIYDRRTCDIYPDHSVQA